MQGEWHIELRYCAKCLADEDPIDAATARGLAGESGRSCRRCSGRRQVCIPTCRDRARGHTCPRSAFSAHIDIRGRRDVRCGPRRPAGSSSARSQGFPKRRRARRLFRLSMPSSGLSTSTLRGMIAPNSTAGRPSEQRPQTERRKQQKDVVARVCVVVEEERPRILGYHAINLGVMNVNQLERRHRSGPALTGYCRNGRGRRIAADHRFAWTRDPTKTVPVCLVCRRRYQSRSNAAPCTRCHASCVTVQDPCTTD